MASAPSVLEAVPSVDTYKNPTMIGFVNIERKTCSTSKCEITAPIKQFSSWLVLIWNPEKVCGFSLEYQGEIAQGDISTLLKGTLIASATAITQAR
jgi:hypothetical protein